MTTTRRFRLFHSPGHALGFCAGLGLLWVASQVDLAAPPAPDDAAPKEAAADITSSPLFDADVLPIFQAHCTRCHGDKSRKAGLDLSSQEGAFGGSESGPVIAPGSVDESLLWKMLREGKMPPGKNAHLNDTQTATIRAHHHGFCHQTRLR